MRGIETGKTRLAPVLDAAARARLNRWLLTRTLDVIGQWQCTLARCIVVSPCAMTLELARLAGAETVHEHADAQELNAAVALGAAYAARRSAGRVLALPCDLPWITAESLTALAREAGPPGHVVIAPDRARNGTNALLIDVSPLPEFRFGSRSFARHLAWAAVRGRASTVLFRPELEFDLDTPEDFGVWSRGLMREPADVILA
ncbi:MAG: 2-phospho-L-lactate guanylyltransferase [Betaproteobacteria bacterium]|nr:2-phospho-L-lactate guanylyltransferase [Betaproteobacteria bacterium]MDH3437988.1 2-phospho-L-lactate guanylyltransferase [Betaproteobacteria bacterium]